MQEKRNNIGFRMLLFFGLGAIGCTADLVSKHLVFSHDQLTQGSEWWLWEDHIGIQKGVNEGALFGMGQGATGFFAVISIAAIMAIAVWLFWYGAARDLFLTATLGCMLGGIVGNLYDRLGLHAMQWDVDWPDLTDQLRTGETIYGVRDWILFRWSPELSWPNFNIADSLLVVGTIVLFVYFWKEPPPEELPATN